MSTSDPAALPKPTRSPSRAPAPTAGRRSIRQRTNERREIPVGQRLKAVLEMRKTGPMARRSAPTPMSSAPASGKRVPASKKAG